MTSEFLKMPELPEDYSWEITMDTDADLRVAIHYTDKNANSWETNYPEVVFAWARQARDVPAVAEALADKFTKGLPLVGRY